MDTLMNVQTSFAYPVLEEIRDRRSIRAFDVKPVEQEKIHSLFEAARWAPSSANEQPWTNIYATKDQHELWGKLLEPLNDSNKIWVKDAPLLVLSVVRKNFAKHGKLNAFAKYDLGAANAFLALQAVSLGLQAHQMAGYNADKLSANVNLPEEYELGSVIAIGYPGNPGDLPENLKVRELAERQRVPQKQFVRNDVF